MKKLLIALLLIIGVLGIAAVGVGYYVYRQVRSTVTQFAELGDIPSIERGIRVRGFVPPASEELTQVQVDRFVRVQARVRERIGERFAELERKYKTLADKEEAALSDVPAIAAAYRDIISTWLDAKRAQVAALNEVELSLEEYRWIRDQAYRAIGRAFVDLDVAKIVEQFSSGDTPDDPAARLRGAVEAAGPVVNRKLVESIRKQLEENLPLASFGL